MNAGTNSEYADRYCAFVDILGFSELVASLEDESSFALLRDLLKIIYKPLDPVDPRFRHSSDVRAQSISDAICMSTLRDRGGLLHLLIALTEIALRLLEKGFFLRGAIVRGRLHHDDRMVFGEALVKAYLLERDVVRFPRIMLTNPVVADIQALIDAKVPFSDPVAGAIEQARDGPYYVNILEGMRAVGQRPHMALNVLAPQELSRYTTIAQQVQRRFREANDNPRNFEKVQWFAAYWNRKVRQMEKEKPEFKDKIPTIVGIGLEP